MHMISRVFGYSKSICRISLAEQSSAANLARPLYLPLKKDQELPLCLQSSIPARSWRCMSVRQVFPSKLAVLHRVMRSGQSNPTSAKERFSAKMFA